MLQIPNKVYDVLKWVAIIVMPALATLVTVIFQVWGIPYGDQIATTITALATFLGICLGVSSFNYGKHVDIDECGYIAEDDEEVSEEEK